MARQDTGLKLAAKDNARGSEGNGRTGGASASRGRSGKAGSRFTPKMKLIGGAIAAWSTVFGIAVWSASNNPSPNPRKGNPTAAKTSGVGKFEFKVLDTRVLKGVKVDNLTVEELSGLTWDEDEGQLFAVSDKGRLFRFELPADGTLEKLKLLSGSQLRGIDNTRFAKGNANAEGLDGVNMRNGVKGDGELLMALEANTTLGRFNTAGRLRQQIPLPEALNDPSKFVAPERGLESVAMHPTLGLLTAPERPLTSNSKSVHTIYAATGRSFQIGKDVAGEADVKAIEVLADGRVMTLERFRSPDRTAYKIYLRVTSITSCKEGTLCPSSITEVVPLPSKDGNFEGLTRVGTDTFLMVSDDLIEDQRRTVFVLFRLNIKP